MKKRMSELSQEEIDALFNGGTAASSETPPADTSATASGKDAPLSDIEKDALGEIGNISMGSAATTLSVLLGHKVSINTPTVSLDTVKDIKDRYPMPFLIVEVGYTIGIDGNNILAIKSQDASIIADLMMGGNGTNPPEDLNEIHMSAVGESMNQMMGAVSTSLSTMFNMKIDISPPIVNLIDLGSEEKVTEIVSQDDPVVRISFRMEVEGLIDSEIMQILPLDVAKDMVSKLMNTEPEEEEAPPVPITPAKPESEVTPTPVTKVATNAPTEQMPATQAPMVNQTQPMGGYGMSTPHIASNVPVQPAQFTPLSTTPVAVNDANIGLILDVPLQVTVELGRTKKSIKEILELSTGSIVELDKLAGEPVDIQVNGKLLAKGEVVVIDENFGVRITDIVTPEERARSLN